MLKRLLCYSSPLALLALPCFAEGDLPVVSSGFSVTSALVEPIETAISSGLTVLVPIGIGIMAVMLGIGLIPRIIYKFL